MKFTTDHSTKCESKIICLNHWNWFKNNYLNYISWAKVISLLFGRNIDELSTKEAHKWKTKANWSANKSEIFWCPIRHIISFVHNQRCSTWIFKSGTKWKNISKQMNIKQIIFRFEVMQNSSLAFGEYKYIAVQTQRQFKSNLCATFLSFVLFYCFSSSTSSSTYFALVLYCVFFCTYIFIVKFVLRTYRFAML